MVEVNHAKVGSSSFVLLLATSVTSFAGVPLAAALNSAPGPVELHVPTTVTGGKQSVYVAPEEEIADPTSIPRFVPDEWVRELNSIRHVERPGAFEDYYEQD